MAREISFKRVRYPKKREFKLDKAILFILLGIFLVFLLVFLFYKPDINGSGEVISEEQEQQEDDIALIRFVIEIINAWRLDENRKVISDIYPEVSALDDVWSETINDGEYIRITFEQQLTSKNDITIYPRVVSGNPRIEVYEENENDLIAEFTSLKSNQYNKVFLTNLQGSQDTFDLRVLDGAVEFDHIVDPPQFARPDADVNLSTWTDQAGGTTNIFQSIDEVTADDADYIESINKPPPTDIYIANLSDVTDPEVSTGHIIRWRYAKDASAGVQIDFNLTLKQSDGTAIASRQFTDVSNVVTQDNYTLTAAEADAITNYAELEVHIWADAVGGGPGRTGRSHWVEFEVPAVAADTEQPKWQENTTNSTEAGTLIIHSVRWTDDTALDGFIFSFDNGTGTFVNDTFVSMTGADNYSNVTKFVNQTVGSTIQWIVYANDSSNNWNNTDTFSYVTTDTTDPVVGQKFVNETSVNANEAIRLNVTDVTDNIQIDIVYTTITYPNNTIVNVTMTDIGGDSFAINLSVGSTGGTFYYNTTYANDTSGNLGENTTVLSVTVNVPDIEQPKWQFASVNDSTPLPNRAVRHNVNWTDNSVLQFAILEVNSTGASCNTAANVSETTLSGGSQWANLTWLVPNACEGQAIGWKQYANDTAGNMNITNTQVYVVQNVAPVASFGTNPVDNFNSSLNSVTFDLKVSDNLNVDALRLYGNWTGTWTINQTNMSAVNDSYWNITVTGIPEGIHRWAAWGNDTVGNFDFTTNRTFIVDLTIPNVSINSPQNISYDTNSITFNVTSTDNFNVNSCQYSLDGATNVSLTNSAANYWTDTNASMTQSGHTVNYYCDDFAGNLNDTESVTFFVDSLNPQIEFTTGTEANASSKNQQWIFVNVSVTETNFANITYKLYNSTGPLNETTYTSQVLQINWTGLLDANVQYWYNVSVYDTLNNFNETETRYITLTQDNPPKWQFASVNDSTPLPNRAVRHNVNWTDDTDLSYATLEINSTGASCDTTLNVTSTTLSGGSQWANLTWLVPAACEGQAIGWKQWANDSIGQWNVTDTQVYVVQNINPTTSFGTNPVDNFNSSLNSVTFDLKVSDNLNVDALRLYGNWTGTWTINQTNMTAVNDSYWNVTVTGIPDGKNHVWAAWGNDTVGNSDFTDTNRTFTVDTTPPSISGPFSNETDIFQNEIFCLNITVTDATMGVDVVWAEVNDTTALVNYTMTDTGSTTCDDGNGDGVYGVSIVGNNFGIWNYTKVFANDTFGNSDILDFTDISINVTAVPDTVFPIFSNFDQNVTNNSNYSFSQVYDFNVSVLNNNGTVFLSFNNINYSATNLTFETFNATIGGLGAGTYSYFWWGYGNGTNENYNSSIGRSYVVQKSLITANLTNNDTWTVTYPTAVSIGRNELNEGDGDVTYVVWRDDVNKGTGEDVVLGVGGYNYKLNTTGGTNYTGNSSLDAQTLTVSANAGNCQVLFNDTSPVTFPEVFNVSTNCNSAFTLSINGTSISNNSEQALGAGAYNFSVQRTDTVNYTNIYDEQEFVVSKATPVLTQFLNGTNDNLTITYPQQVNASAYTTAGTLSIFRNSTGVTSENTLNISLVVGYYLYTFNVTGNQNYSDVSSVFLYALVNQGTGNITTYINNIRDNRTTSQFNEEWLNATLVTGSGNIELYYNDSLINQGASPLSNLTNFTEVGVFNVTGFYSGNENYTSDFETWWVTVTSDQSPIVNVTFPLNQTYNVDVTELNYTATDDNSLDTCWYSLNGGATNITITCGDNVTGLISNEGANNWTVYANDSIGQESSDVVIFTKDTVDPNVQFVSPTTAIGNFSQNYIEANVTASDATTGLDTITLFLYNSTSLVQTNISSASPLFVNFTGLPDETYYLNSTANDTAGNENQTETRTIVLDTTNPSVSYNSNTDADNSFVNRNWVFINITASDKNKDTVMFEWNNVNETFASSSGNLYWENKTSLSDGAYSFYAWANDTAGNFNSTATRTVTVDTTNPLIDYTTGTPVDNANLSQNYIFVNVSITETNFQNITFSLYNSTSEVNTTTYTSQIFEINWTSLLDEVYTYNVTIVDKALNENSTATRTATIDTGPPTVNYVSPTENSGVSRARNYIEINVTASDPKLDKIIIRLYDSSNNLINSATTSSSPNFINFTSLSDGLYFYNATANDTFSNEADLTTRNITLDATKPNVQFVSPTTNTGNYSQDYIEANVTASDSLSGLDTITIYLYNSTSLVQTNTSSTSPLFVNFTGLPDGTYSLNSTANDTVGNENQTETRTIILDSTPPQISYNSNTDNSFVNRNWVFINVTASDLTKDTVGLEWQGTNETFDNIAGDLYWENKTGLGDGSYSFYAWINDTSGNFNSTATRTVTVDTTIPSVTNLVESPSDPATWSSGATYEFNATITDDNLDIVLIEFDNVNYTPTNLFGNVYNLTLSDLAAGNYNYYWWANDSAGNVNLTSDTYTINNATGDITLLINGSASNQTAPYTTQTNASAATLYGSMTLYRNGTDVTPDNNVFVTLAAEYYNYTAVSSGDQNHSSASTTLFVDISKAASEVNLTLNVTDGNVTIDQGTSIYLNVTTVTGDSGATLKLYNNGTLINQGTSPLSNFTNFPSINVFNITGIYNGSQNYTSSFETWYVNVTQAPDLTNPSVSSLTESPTDPANYSEGATYEFNATVTDNIAVDIVLIDFNGTNHTATNLIGNIYNVTLTDLSVGTYNYRWYANDSAGNLNSTENGSYTINQAAPTLNITISPSNTVTYGTETNATGSNCPSQLTCTLYRDSVSVSNPEIATLAAGTYNYTFNTTGNANYTSDSISDILTVNQDTGSCNVLFNETSPITYPSLFRVWSNCTSDFVLYRNSTSISNNSVQNLAVGIYNFTVIRNDTANYSNFYDEQNFVVNQATGVVFTYLNNSRANITIEQFIEIYLNATLDTGSGDIELYYNDTRINVGTSPLSNLTNFTDIGLFNVTGFYSGNENYTSDFETWWVNVTELDVTPPNIQIDYPTNISYTAVQTELNYTASDNFGLNTCWYSLDNGATNITITCGQNVTGLNSGQDSSTWRVYANDIKGNENSSSVTFFVDSIIPTISFTSPTETSGSSLGRNYIQVNVTVSDTNLDTITIRLYNSTNDLIRENLSSSSPFFINYTGLSAGTYSFNSTVNDTLNNQNSTATRNVSLVIPSLTIVLPENETYIDNESLRLNYTASLEDSVWYNIDAGTNTTISGNTTFNTTEGGHTLNLYANNSNGETLQNVIFTVNFTKFSVIYGEFSDSVKGTSTDFNKSSYEDLQNLSNIILENTDHGKIELNEAINLTNDADLTDNQIDLDTYTNISSNRIEINSTALPNLNKSATLYLYGLTFSRPRILKDEVVCPSTICVQNSYSGGTLSFNVTHFTVYSAEETPTDDGDDDGGPGGGGGGVECTNNSQCEGSEICWNYQCAKLFDIKIIDFESPVKLGEFFEFTYFVKGVAEINADVEISFWIEKGGEIVTSGKDVIYLGSFEEKTETTKIFLPSGFESGIYEFHVRVNHPSYSAESFRTIEVQVKEGTAIIGPIEFKNLQKYIVVGLIVLAVLILGVIFYIERKKFIREFIQETRWLVKHKTSVFTALLFVVLSLIIYFLNLIEVASRFVLEVNLWLKTNVLPYIIYILVLGIIITLFILLLKNLREKKFFEKLRERRKKEKILKRLKKKHEKKPEHKGESFKKFTGKISRFFKRIFGAIGSGFKLIGKGLLNSLKAVSKTGDRVIGGTKSELKTDVKIIGKKLYGIERKVKEFEKPKKPRIKFRLPKLKVPKIKLPRIKLPKINLSKAFKALSFKKERKEIKKEEKVKRIKFKVPGLEVPRVKLPKFKLPGLEVPKIKLPKIKVPKIDLSKDFKALSFKKERKEIKKSGKMFALDINKEAEELKKIRFKLPGLEVPKIKLPRIKFPKLKHPRIDLSKAFSLRKEKVFLKKGERKIGKNVREVSRFAEEIHDEVSKALTTAFGKKTWKSLVKEFEKKFAWKKRHKEHSELLKELEKIMKKLGKGERVTEKKLLRLRKKSDTLIKDLSVYVKKMHLSAEIPELKKSLKFKKGMVNINKKMRDIDNAVIRFFSPKKKQSEDAVKEFFQKAKNNEFVQKIQKEERPVSEKPEFPQEKQEPSKPKENKEKDIIEDIAKKEQAEKDISQENSETPQSGTQQEKPEKKDNE